MNRILRQAQVDVVVADIQQDQILWDTGQARREHPQMVEWEIENF